jgi:hypothetical protein
MKGRTCDTMAPVAAFLRAGYQNDILGNRTGRRNTITRTNGPQEHRTACPGHICKGLLSGPPVNGSMRKPPKWKKLKDS